MKKIYKKPVIFFESFTLSTSIASDCDHPFDLQAKFLCHIPDENGLGMNLFDPYKPGSTCTIDAAGMNDSYDGFCYHTSASNAPMLFNS